MHSQLRFLNIEKYIERPLAAHQELVEKYQVLSDLCLGDIVRDAIETFATRELPARLCMLERTHVCSECAGAQGGKVSGHRRVA